MFDNNDATVSLRHIQALLRDIEHYSELEEDFSLVDMVDSLSLPGDKEELLTDLVRHHYSLVKERRPDLTLADYDSMFPQHSEWSQFLSKDSVSFLEPDEHSESVPEFMCGPLEDLSLGMQKILLKKMQPVSFRRGESMVTQGTQGDCLLVCTSGSATVMAGQSEATKTELGKIFPGHVFGEMALMGTPYRTATVTADDDVEALRLSKKDFLDLCEKHQAFASVITMIIADRLGRRSHDALSTVTLEGYRIEKRLGKGGMAVIYDAHQIDTKKRVALKMMSHRLAFDEDAKEWFDREAEIISKFEHPHIPTLYDRFDAFATSFMVMEFVEGVSLAEVLRDVGPLDEDSILKVIAQLAKALTYAHGQGVVHRDVKPSNGMIDRSGQVKLMDFGLSLPIFDEGGQSSAVGTPAYISPEQLAGKICPEGDWFSLGLIAFELSTGRKVFEPKTLLQLSRQFDDWTPNVILNEVPENQPTLRHFVGSFLSLDPSKRIECLKELDSHFEPVNVEDWSCWE